MDQPSTEPAGGPLRVLLVDDHEVVLEGLRSMLASQQKRVGAAPLEGCQAAVGITPLA
jgi:DNA-binding NarL/FixJ family response regulator